VEYNGFKPVRIDTVVLSTQHAPEATHDEIVERVRKDVIDTVLPRDLVDSKTRYLINPTGRFVRGGPYADCGLTGRKIIVDTYGGMGRHGGGAFSGKDPSKVDRSAAYAARWVARNIVDARLARRCEVQFAYAIGVAEPVSVLVETFGTGVVPDDRLERVVREVFDLTPKGIIKALGLRRPLYRVTAAYGHFGRPPVKVGTGAKAITFFPWERSDRVAALRAAAR
ncbi:MAG: methionine adenosyltransferase domain-containing protein, partial [Gemmatimonadota bacterium]